MSFSLITKYFPNNTEKQKSQFEQLQELYTYWNERINVISRKDIDSLYEKHVLHSLSIAKFFDFPKGSKILDVGTGGGFPGIPLAILFPQAQFVLVDSIGKKIKVVNEIASALGLRNVTAFHERAEKINQNFHFVVSRAVTEFSNFVPWVDKKIEKQAIASFKNGILYLKGGDLTEELKLFPKAQLFSVSEVFQEEFFESKKIVYLAIN